jgi:hypothetical protein
MKGLDGFPDISHPEPPADVRELELRVLVPDKIKLRFLERGQLEGALAESRVALQGGLGQMRDHPKKLCS